MRTPPPSLSCRVSTGHRGGGGEGTRTRREDRTQRGGKKPKRPASGSRRAKLSQDRRAVAHVPPTSRSWRPRRPNCWPSGWPWRARGCPRRSFEDLGGAGRGLGEGGQEGYGRVESPAKGVWIIAANGVRVPSTVKRDSLGAVLFSSALIGELGD